MGKEFESHRKQLRCRVHPLGYLKDYEYVVICTSYEGKWVLSKHKKRDTWETQGGHIESGELPESEIERIGIFDVLPEALTYPQTSPVLYAEA